MDINFELYKVFYCVAKTLSFSDAARELYISQSAVSQSVKMLEKRLGMTLFVRSTKKVRLTTEGEILLKHIEPAVALIHRGEKQLQDSQTLSAGQIRIGASDTICRYFLVPYINQFHKRHPGVLIKVTNSTSFGCVDLLENNQVDIILVNAPNLKLNRIRDTEVIREFKDVFVTNPQAFPLTGRRVELAELQNYPILMLERNSTTSEYLYNLFLQHQLELVPTLEVTSNDLLIDFARIGLGVAFLPDYCVTPSDDLAVISLAEELPRRKLVLAKQDQVPLSAAAESFLEMLRNG
ncbi:MAG: LysR family transcriptional regulator [Lachnospiraceae bacterium]|nr:LysR family transcriptional regulator [Lachnospiraceae bacterium]